MNRIDHTNCPHESTSRDRAACRAAHAEGLTDILNLIEIFNSASFLPSPNAWIFRAAHRFASFQGDDLHAAARAILDHFAPSGDEDRDAHRRASGYTITTDPHTMLRMILRASA